MEQSFWENLYLNWAWLGVPVMVIALAALRLLIAGVMSLMKQAQLFRVPLVERQEVQFKEAGRFVLGMEGPLLTRRFAKVDFELHAITGEKVEGGRAWFRARSSSLSKVRMELLKYDIPRPGRYVLTMTGLGEPRANDADHAVVFAKPHLAGSVAYVLGILLASGVFIASLVFFLLRVLAPGGVD